MNLNTSNNFMTIDNLKDLVKIYKNFIKDTYNFNIDNTNINLKKVIFTLMEKVNSTTYANTLKLEDLNKITLKNVRDYVYENYKHIFPSENQFSTIHRESQINSNRNNRIELDLRDKVIHNNKTIQNKDIKNNFKKTETIRNFEVTKIDKIKKNIDFSERNEKILTKTDFTDKMNQLQNERDEFMRNSKKRDNNNELQPNVEININSEDSSTNTLLMNKLDETQTKNNIETNNNVEGFDFSAFDDDNVDNFVSFENNNMDNNSNIDTNISMDNSANIDTNININIDNVIKETSNIQNTILTETNTNTNIDPIINNIEQQDTIGYEQEQNIQYINKQKIIINSNDRDKLIYPKANKYSIEFKNSIENVIKIKLVNVLINLNKFKDEQNYAILKLNNFNNIISNNKNILNTFAILYNNKIYDDEIEFYKPLEKLNNFDIEINNINGELYEFIKNQEHIFEFIIEYI